MQRRLQHEWLVADAVQAVNALNAARIGAPLEARLTPCMPDNLSFSELQQAAAARLGARVRQVGPPPPEPRKEEALRALLKSDDDYSRQRDANVRPYDLAKIRVCRGDLTPKDVETVLSPEARMYAADPERWIVLPDSALADVADGPALWARPYWDPVLRHSRSKLAELLVHLDKAQLITWRGRARASVGIFYVGKKDGSLRVVVDGRIPSAMHRRPPRSDLAVPAALSRLMLPDEALELGDVVDRRSGLAEETSLEPVEITGSSADLTDGFYQFFSERLASWFSLGYVCSGEEVGQLLGQPFVACFDDDTQSFVAAYASSQYAVCFRGLPMGWSWSLYFCNDAISSCMKSALASCGLRTTLVADKAHPVIASSRPAPRLTWTT